MSINFGIPSSLDITGPLTINSGQQITATGNRLQVNVTNITMMISDSGNLSALSVTGSNVVPRPIFTGVGGTIVYQSGNFVFVSGGIGAGTVTQAQLDSVSGWANNNFNSLSGWTTFNLTATGVTLYGLFTGLSGALNTGTQNISFNNLVYTTGNQDIGSVKSFYSGIFTGRLGIGTNSPSSSLHVVSTNPNIAFFGGNVQIPTIIVSGSNGSAFWGSKNTIPFYVNDLSGTFNPILSLTRTYTNANSVQDRGVYLKLSAVSGTQIAQDNFASEFFIGYNTGIDAAYLQSVHQGASFTPIYLQPQGGNVGIGTSGTISSILHIKQNSVTPNFRIDNSFTNGKWITLQDNSNNEIFAISRNGNGAAITTYNGGVADLILGLTNQNSSLVVSGASSQIAHYFNINSFGNTGGNIFSVDSGGKVGIGTVNPAALLEVFGGSTSLATQVRLHRTNVAEMSLGVYSGNGAYFSTNADSFRFLYNNGGNAGINGTEMVRFTSGSVGIGLSVPQATLHVVGTGYTVANFSNPKSVFSSIVVGNMSGSGYWGSYVPDNIDYVPLAVNDWSGLANACFSVNKYYVDTGILEDRGVFIRIRNSTGRQIAFDSFAQDLLIGYSTGKTGGYIQAVWQNIAYTPLSLQPNGGFVGINTQAPTHPLHITTTNSEPVLIENTDTNSYSQILFGTTPNRRYQIGVGGSTVATVNDKLYIYDAAVGFRFALDSAGRFGFGTTAPSAYLHATGSVRFADLKNGVLATDTNGNLFITGVNLTGTFNNVVYTTGDQNIGNTKNFNSGTFSGWLVAGSNVRFSAFPNALIATDSNGNVYATSGVSTSNAVSVASYTGIIATGTGLYSIYTVPTGMNYYLTEVTVGVMSGRGINMDSGAVISIVSTDFTQTAIDRVRLSVFTSGTYSKKMMKVEPDINGDIFTSGKTIAVHIASGALGSGSSQVFTINVAINGFTSAQ